VIPYAADVRRFRPQAKAGDASACTFLFAGGVTQRKGVGYLLKAWAKVARPGWRLQLVGALPRRLGPLEANLKLAGVEPLGRVGPEEVAARMAAADVFVFPSLFEGSAVVTYEALASGLPCVATAESGTVARDGVEGFLVAARDVDALAERMIRLGGSPELRARMAAAARRRAEEYDWPRYHAAVNRAIEAAVVEKQGRATYREELTHG
jgi:glycosyltransferase involved in cell wall biosynthesis